MISIKLSYNLLTHSEIEFPLLRGYGLYFLLAVKVRIIEADFGSCHFHAGKGLFWGVVDVESLFSGGR